MHIKLHRCQWAQKKKQCMHESHPITPASQHRSVTQHIVIVIEWLMQIWGKKPAHRHTLRTLNNKRNQFSLNNFSELHWASQVARTFFFSSIFFSVNSFLWMDKRRTKFDTFQLFGNLNGAAAAVKCFAYYYYYCSNSSESAPPVRKQNSHRLIFQER